MKIVFVLVAVLMLNQNSVTSSSIKKNKIWDSILRTVQLKIRNGNRDTLNLPTEQIRFKRKIGFIKISGGAKIHSGKISGLSSIKRKSGIHGKVSNGHHIIEVRLGFDRLAVSYKMEAWLGKIKVRGSAKGAVKNVQFRMKVKKSTRPNSKAKLESLEVANIGDIDIDIKGLGPITWAFSKVSSLATNAIKNQVSRLLRPMVNRLLSLAINNFRF